MFKLARSYKFLLSKTPLSKPNIIWTWNKRYKVQTMSKTLVIWTWDKRYKVQPCQQINISLQIYVLVFMELNISCHRNVFTNRLLESVKQLKCCFERRVWLVVLYLAAKNYHVSSVVSYLKTKTNNSSETKDYLYK